MALDPHPDREPGMDARVVIHAVCHDECSDEVWAKNIDGYWWELTGLSDSGQLTWAELTELNPDAVVVLP